MHTLSLPRGIIDIRGENGLETSIVNLAYRAGHGYIGILNTLFCSFCEFPVTLCPIPKCSNTFRCFWMVYWKDNS